jgi:ketosteroid isomerase-like protein
VRRLSGEYQGRDAVLQFLRQTMVLTDRTYNTELQYVTADEDRAVAVYRARGTRGARTLDIDQALFCLIEDGTIKDVTAVPFDFPAFSAFWAA